MKTFDINSPERQDAVIEQIHDQVAGVSSDPNLSALLGMLNGSGTIDPMAILLSRLEAQAESDPNTAQIVKYLEQSRLQQMQDTTSISEDTWSEDEEYIDIDDQVSEELGLRDQLEQINSELEVLRPRNDALAAALGACYLCFGGDSHCEECNGRGVPGSLRPDPAYFRQYVVPALNRIKSIKSKRNVQSHDKDGHLMHNSEAHIASD